MVTFSYLVRMISDSSSLNKRQLVLCSEYIDFGCKTSLALITISALMKLDFSQGSSEIHPEQHSTCQQNGGKYRTSLYSSREYLPSKKIRYNPQSIQQMRQMTTEMTYDDSHLLRMVLVGIVFPKTLCSCVRRPPQWSYPGL